MNGIEKITARILSEADAEVTATLKAADEKVATIKADYAQKAEAEYESLMAKGKSDCEQRLAHRARLVRLDAKKELLGEKMSVLNLSYDKAKELLLKLPREEYLSFLTRLALKAAKGGEELIMNATDAGSIGEELVSKLNEKLEAPLTLSATTRDITGGFILKQGNIEVNCTPEALLEMNRSSLDAETAKLLFA